MDELTPRRRPTPMPAAARIGGQVRAPGEYPLETGMRVSDLLRAGGGLSEAAYATDAELTRYEVIDGEYRETEFVTVDLAGCVPRRCSARTSHWLPMTILTSRRSRAGAARRRSRFVARWCFPATYPIRRGETLSSALRASRRPHRSRVSRRQCVHAMRSCVEQRARADRVLAARRIERDIAAIPVTDPKSASDDRGGADARSSQLREAVATGRLVIRLDDIVRRGS